MPPILAGFLASSAWGADIFSPAPLPMDRYAAMSERSPFALATPVTPAAAPQASFAANWFVSGIARLGDVDFVTIKSRDLSTQFSLFGREPLDGVSVASVSWSEVIGKSTVILQKGTETAKLEFNEADLRAPQPATAGSSAAPGNLAANLTQLPDSPSSPSRSASGGIPIIVPGAAARPFPAGASNPTAVQRRVRIISQPR